jgi:hypothetical protein
MADLEITLRVEKEWRLAEDAESNRNADPSLYAPWGKMSYPPNYERVPCVKDGGGNPARLD